MKIRARNCVHRSVSWSPLFLFSFLITCFALLPNAQGVSPAPDGGYPNGNTAEGENALKSNTTGRDNTAVGYNSLGSNTTGRYNTANGASALSGTTTGRRNTATGASALVRNSTGDSNTANGHAALLSNTTGQYNTALGAHAGDAQRTGSGNVYIGYGMSGVDGESNACYIRSIFGQASSGGVPVLINSSNKLGTMTSSKRFKENIKQMDTASDRLFGLKPVTFRYRKEIDPAGTPQFGLVAEEVEKVEPDLVVHDNDGKAYAVRYDAVNAMLLNEFLKEHRTVEELKKEVAALTAGLQSVSAQLELSKSVPRTVLNNQ
jgi:Chaperone of endosialidase